MRRVGVDVERKEKGACVVVEFIVTTETTYRETNDLLFYKKDE